ncbi:16S rRNA (guanine(966)-N(2))-methyltransferase RsmD [Methylobacillus caricis]|uniref:16S rRNA (guanine(966)-N(2))-methyltransferase RsmD n=1 Tax=Methylobacillus caricis TaxID=1971611 RepID=UPI001CFFF914|nr:16S rRNA (guanine(966)-N(2))-methyltransferase RsmD [Methylobacillus caricis]MCB5186849.1 16S rRNA (guanine(966)-N(2))-methyltransferase RsmD [Methylobacillus caricis]
MAASNRVRIGGGEWRSRLLSFPDIPGLRPTPDRVRQTLFNWLGQDLHGLSCLDLFSGTGVMGFEALSRGAAQAVMVEKSLPAVKSLQENKSLLKADKARILQQDALQFLAQNRELFNIIFVDPPYQQGWLPKLLPILAPHLASQGYVYAEAEYALESGLVWQVHKHGKAGNVFYHLLKLTDESAN